VKFILLAPLAFIYHIINYFWDLYWRNKKPVKLAAKVISVGNITVGGAGKTSIAGYIAESLLQRGHRIALVARGYKRPNNGPIVISGSRHFSWEDCGDEPAALAKSIPGLSIYVNSNKTRAAKQASKDGFEFIIIDDGFQHRNIFRDLNIVCLNGSNPFGNGFLLPSGILREPKRAIARADAIVIVDESFESDMARWGLPNRIPIFRAKKIVAGIKSLDGLSADLKGKKVVGFCGLGNPESFHNSLKDVGCDIRGLLNFRDHHIYKRSDINKIMRMYKNENCHAAVTTLKDAVKLERIWPPDVLFYYLEITIKFEKEAEFFKLVGV
jgi:tetraacyldisaccharide 4'-kinase